MHLYAQYEGHDCPTLEKFRVGEVRKAGTKQILAVTFNCVSLCGSRDVVIQISFPSDIEKPALDHPSVKMGIIVPFRLIMRI